ncbi:TonB-dependent receptor [Paraflavitalea sp. CAU 1676]|uniref:SusC/RagA family TonB-linked outer membrane protein n=1 Tax=Paraflavitalea sp. CAU 1676 TaxID=3032598 RepID=UPI0023DB42DE|nr:TonB-dependent receptor [Paraflavitalea sp. CAU 1676]MDF2188273.1 TonB-dependent receptor [Paraflavitalea sp. CAU 1676]
MTTRSACRMGHPRVHPRNSLFALPVFLLLFLLSAVRSQAQDISGTVSDSTSLQPISGVSVVIKGTKQGTSTDDKGRFSLDISGAQAVLEISYVGYRTKEVLARKGVPVRVQLALAVDTTGDVIVVAYGRQKRQSLVSSITSINPKELRGPTSNLTSMLAGRISGVIAYQQSGEPGADNAAFFIRGVGSFGAGKRDPLILIDGMESSNTDLARLQPDDITGFSVLKDAAAASLYGARGANGVILVTTKLGHEGKAKFNIRLEAPVSTNTRNFKFADNVTYMKLANESVLTRDPLGVLPYSQNKIDHTAAGDDPLQYPNNNWIDQLIKDYTVNQKANINVAGGGKTAQYYIAGTWNIDRGILRTVPGSSFNSNIKLNNYSVRSNISINITPSTKAIVRTSGQFDDYNGPIGYRDGDGNWVNGGKVVFNSAIWSNPVMFPAYFPSSYAPFSNHPLFGNAFIGNTNSLYNNPFATMVSGFQQYNTSTLNAQIELNQNFNFVTPGLSANLMAFTQRYSFFDVARRYNPFYYTLLPDPNGKLTVLTPLNKGQGTEYLNYMPGSKIVNTVTHAQMSLNYSRTFKDKHAVSGMLIGLIRNFLSANAGDLQSSLPQRNLGVSGRFTYGYDSRYLLEANFGYNGSERFAANHRFGFFPSAGLGWVVSNEPFFEFAKDVVSNMKFRFTYGLVGNDQIGNVNDRFFYLSNVNPNNDGRGFHWGTSQNYYVPGYSISRYANSDITWEEDVMANYGLDLSFANGINLTIDGFKSTRHNILMDRTTIPTTMGLEAGIRANMGKASRTGIDVALDYSKTFNKNLWVQVRGNMTYATSKVILNEEPDYPAGLEYLSRIGKSINQPYGLLAERLFVDDMEASKSPFQSFGGTQPVQGGDIKYRDINGDGVITGLDYVPIGHPTNPEITYGFGFSMGYKGFDLSAFFQGNARVSFFINPYNISPFVQNGGSQNGLLQEIANSHWSEENQDLHAFWPRLDPRFNDNNSQTSNWWLRNGAFLRLKTVELGYNLPSKFLKRFGFSNFRAYANGQNLFAFSKFTLWDPEMGGNGLGYPVQAVYNFGLNFGF